MRRSVQAVPALLILLSSNDFRRIKGNTMGIEMWGVAFTIILVLGVGYLAYR
jgi:hypothetical protein